MLWTSGKNENLSKWFTADTAFKRNPKRKREKLASMQKSCKFVAWKYIATQHKTLIKRKLISRPKGVGEKTLSYATRWSFVSNCAQVGWKTLFRDSNSISRDCRHANCPRATRASTAGQPANVSHERYFGDHILLQRQLACMPPIQCSRVGRSRVGAWFEGDSSTVAGESLWQRAGNDNQRKWLLCLQRTAKVHKFNAVTIVRVRIVGRAVSTRRKASRDVFPCTSLNARTRLRKSSRRHNIPCAASNRLTLRRFWVKFMDFFDSESPIFATFPSRSALLSNFD